METFKHILLCTDGSDPALHAARFAGTLARATGTDVTILAVHQDDSVMLNTMGPALWHATVPYSAMTPEELRESIEQATAKTVLPEAEEACGEGTKISSTVQLWGHVAETICAYAVDHEIDLIVLGTRGQSAFSKLLLGSVSIQVANHASCAVTLVR